MIYCVAEFKAKEGREDELFSKLQSLEKETRVEKGCFFYKVMKVTTSEFAGGESLGMIFNEHWNTKEDFETHCQTPHIVKFFTEECLEETGSAEKFNVCIYE
jgi:quinol monooxygenase YgiN